MRLTIIAALFSVSTLLSAAPGKGATADKAAAPGTRKPADKAAATGTGTPADNAAAKKILKEIRASIHGTPSFSIAQCPRIPPEQWLQLLITGTAVPLAMRFKKDCDTEGDVAVDREPFPVDLKVRHLKGVDRVRATITPLVAPDWTNRTLGLTLKADNGVLFRGKEGELLNFSSVYRASLGMDGKPAGKRVTEITVTRYRGRPVEVKETVESK